MLPASQSRGPLSMVAGHHFSAVISTRSQAELIAGQAERIRLQTEQVRAQAELHRLLTEQIQVLTARGGRPGTAVGCGSNSSRPPSSDAPWDKEPAKPRSARQRSSRKPGKQPGDPGVPHSLSDTPDQVVPIEPQTSRGCCGPLDGSTSTVAERRQVVRAAGDGAGDHRTPTAGQDLRLRNGHHRGLGRRRRPERRGPQSHVHDCVNPERPNISRPDRPRVEFSTWCRSDGCRVV